MFVAVAHVTLILICSDHSCWKGLEIHYKTVRCNFGFTVVVLRRKKKQHNRLKS